MIDGGAEHQTAFQTFLVPSLIGGALEYLNYLGGGSIPPGLSAKVGLAIGASMGGSVEGLNLAKIGIEKLKALRDKNKTTGAGAPQQSPA